MAQISSVESRLLEALRLDRRLRVLLTLLRAPSEVCNEAVLQDVLLSLGHAVSCDLLRTELQWLAEQGLLEARQAGPLWVARIHLLAEHAMRRQQLDEAGEGRWRFVCESPNGERCRSGQRHLRGKVLPASEGRLAFPHLPCTWLCCPGRIVFER